METGVKKLYEAMFLIDSAEAARDWDGIIELISKMLTKADAEIVSIRKWDERALAYPIRRCTRGTYILTYFKGDGKKIHEIERDVQLSERIIRVLILRADHLSEEAIAKDTPAISVEKQKQTSAGSAEAQAAVIDEAKQTPEQVAPAETAGDSVAAQ